METWILLFISIMSLMSLISNAIGIAAINDKNKDSEKFLIGNLVASIVFFLAFGFLLFRNLKTHGATTVPRVNNRSGNIEMSSFR